MKFLLSFFKFYIAILTMQVNAQFDELPPKPESCYRPVEFMYRQCCIFPPFFTRDVAKECGARFLIIKNDNAPKLNLTLMVREADIDEIHWRCVLKRYKMLTSENMLEDDKYFAHLDKWAEFNPSFANVIQDAKAECKLVYGVYFPLAVTEFFKLNGCIRNYVKINCPEIIPIKECEEVKKFYEECGKYFIKK